jgi:hypothetical protein
MLRESVKLPALATSRRQWRDLNKGWHQGNAAPGERPNPDFATGRGAIAILRPIAP